MSFTKKCLATAVAASTLAMGAVAPVATAEVSGSVGIASSYLWRGFDLGPGIPAVWGDLSYSQSGFYAGIWGSSGDANDTEYDLYAGYGHEFGDFSVDISVWNYIYPTGTLNIPGEAGETDFGDLSEVILTLGYGPVSLSYYDNVAGGTGYTYLNLSASFGAFTAAVGRHDPDDDSDETPTHLDLSYAYNDNLSFTFSQFVADESDDDDLKFVVGYTLPIGE